MVRARSVAIEGILSVGFICLFLMSPPCRAEEPAPRNFSETLIQGIESSDDPTYGYTEENPVKIGGGQKDFLGHRLRDLYLDILRGPNGKRIKFERVGQGGMYRSPNGPGGFAFIDLYEIRSKDLDGTKSLYISIYDFEEPKIPQGLTVDREYVENLLDSVKETLAKTKPN